MSAITGIYQTNEEQVNLQHGQLLMATLQKYPADDIQTWNSNKVFLGCHAQWITPESVGERLPFYDYERQCVITADAIIDNREELFEKLQVDSSKQKHITDSELILYSYYKWGEDSPTHLIGDFAFIIWDEKKEKMFGARDFSGNRTLYYHKAHGTFAFCTTIEPLHSLPYVEKKINEQWLAEFLAIPSMSDVVDAASTVYQDIEQIPPAHKFSIVSKQMAISRYITIDFNEKLYLSSNNEYEEAFKEVFQKAVTSRFRTHRKIGSNLSGGLDSGSVVSFAAKELQKHNKKLYTFSAIPIDQFKDWTPKYRIADERPMIKSIADYVGNIEDHYFSFEDKNPFSEIDDWLEIMEMPYKFFENSVWVKGVYEEAQNLGVGVLLNGSRGNFTISWGPILDYYAHLLKRKRLLHLYNEVSSHSKRMGVSKSRLIKVVGKKAYPFLSRTKLNSHDDLLLINKEFARRTQVFSKLEELAPDIMGNYARDINDIRKYHFGNLNSWSTTATSGAKLSLKYSLQGHDPTNDLRVIQFCLSLPLDQFVQNGYGRSLIRRSTSGYLPDDVRLNQITKGIQGVDIVTRMLPEWKVFISELQCLSKDPMIANYLNIEAIKSAIKRFNKEPQPNIVFDPQFRLLMRSLIVYRFIKRL